MSGRPSSRHHAPPDATITSKAVWTTLAWSAYVGVFFAGHRRFGGSTAALGFLPAAATGWWWGRRVGMPLAVGVSVVCNSALFVGLLKKGEGVGLPALIPSTLALGVVAGVVGHLHDLRRSLHEQHDQLSQVARHDHLTGLLNRAAFQVELEQALARVTAAPRHLAVLFIDLDDFKPVNDRLGHEVGDLVLQEVARRLRAALRAGDLVARLGGDEFVVLVPALTAPEHARQVVAKVRAAFDAPFEAAGRPLALRASVGVSVAPQDGADPANLVRAADADMYRVKRAAKRDRGAGR